MWTWQQLTVQFPFYHKGPPTLMRFLSYVQVSQQTRNRHSFTLQQCSQRLGNITAYTYRNLAWPPHTRASDRGFRRCAATQLQIAFLLTSTGHLAHNGEEKQLISVFSWLSLTCSLHTEKRVHNYLHPSFPSPPISLGHLSSQHARASQVF